MSPIKKDLTILQGRTFSYPLKWEIEPIVYKPITAITQAAPCVVTAVGHGLPDGWRVAIVSVKGMTQINASNPPKDSEYVVAKKLTTDTIELNTVNAAEYKPYTSGGYVQYNTPQDLTSYVARMSIKDKISPTTALLWVASTVYPTGYTVITSTGTILEATVGGTSDVVEPTAAGVDGTVTWGAVSSFAGSRELMSLTTANTRILIDNTTKTITLEIDAADTAAITWKAGTYDLELESPSGVVTALMYGAVKVTKEVTT
jgi:hypothetical protein